MADWTDESRAALIKEYTEANPTAKTSAEIVAELAPKYDTTVNGARMILMRANVYVAKEKASASTAKSGEKKETKQESLDRLTGEIEALGIDADDSIVSKLTGKAAAYFADVLAKATAEEED